MPTQTYACITMYRAVLFTLAKRPKHSKCLLAHEYAIGYVLNKQMDKQNEVYIKQSIIQSQKLYTY